MEPNIKNMNHEGYRRLYRDALLSNKLFHKENPNLFVKFALELIVDDKERQNYLDYLLDYDDCVENINPEELFDNVDELNEYLKIKDKNEKIRFLAKSNLGYDFEDEEKRASDIYNKLHLGGLASLTLKELDDCIKSKKILESVDRFFKECNREVELYLTDEKMTEILKNH